MPEATAFFYFLFEKCGLGVENIEGHRRERWTSGGCCFHDGAKSCSAETFGGVDDTGDGMRIKARTVPAER